MAPGTTPGPNPGGAGARGRKTREAVARPRPEPGAPRPESVQGGPGPEAGPGSPPGSCRPGLPETRLDSPRGEEVPGTGSLDGNPGPRRRGCGHDREGQGPGPDNAGTRDPDSPARKSSRPQNRAAAPGGSPGPPPDKPARSHGFHEASATGSMSQFAFTRPGLLIIFRCQAS